VRLNSKHAVYEYNVRDALV